MRATSQISMVDLLEAPIITCAVAGSNESGTSHTLMCQDGVRILHVRAICDPGDEQSGI
jgi:hypothetical protein